MRVGMTGDIEVSPHGLQHRLTGVLDKYFYTADLYSY